MLFPHGYKHILCVSIMFERKRERVVHPDIKLISLYNSVCGASHAMFHINDDCRKVIAIVLFINIVAYGMRDN